MTNDVVSKIERFFTDHEMGVNYYKSIDKDVEIWISIHKNMFTYQKYIFNETIKNNGGFFEKT